MAQLLCDNYNENELENLNAEVSFYELISVFYLHYSVKV